MVQCHAVEEAQGTDRLVQRRPGNTLRYKIDLKGADILQPESIRRTDEIPAELRNGMKIGSLRGRRQVEQSLKEVEAEIKTRLRATDQGALAHDILCSIPGIGAPTAAAILIECPEIGSLGRKQIASLAGLATMTRQSGQWRGQAFIQGRRKFLRNALYMPALVAVRFNPDMTAKYEDMCARGKPNKVTLTAIMRKLLELANALIRDGRKWTRKPA